MFQDPPPAAACDEQDNAGDQTHRRPCPRGISTSTPRIAPPLALFASQGSSPLLLSRRTAMASGVTA
uniref:Uncharacterized protein n=1 Tax=Arundo donax TaxID=35708 RepID=A0A0A8ZDT9_ARUDO